MDTDDGLRGRRSNDPRYPGELLALLREGGEAMSRSGSALCAGDAVDLEKVTLKPP